VYNIPVFSAWLDEKMRVAGLSETALAEMVGVSQQAVSRWHLGIARPGGQRIGKVASALGTGVEEIIKELEEDDDAGRVRPERAADRRLEDQVRDLTERVEQLERLMRLHVGRSR
jgi:transcriptional regulator with XRE-family HTH domain